MPMHNGWLPREGLTGDPVGRFIKRTALNPAFTLIFILLARYTKKGNDLSILHETTFSRIKKLFYFGLIRWASAYLDAGVLNNWTSDKYDWHKEIVLVTGGAGGIGGHVVRLLAEKNIKVVVLDVIPMTFEAGPNVHYYKCDITSPSTLNTIASQITTEVGAPTILILNAGVCRGKTILSTTPADLQFTFSVNTFSHYYLAQTFLPSIIASNHGMVMTVASVAAYIAIPSMTDYAASKAAALSFHEGLTAELKTRYNAPKVRTVLVTQSYTKTPLFEGYKNDSGFLMPSLEPETVAEAIVKKMLRAESGQVIVPGFGATLTALRALPFWYQIRLREKGEGIMTGWRGRQVLDLGEWEKGREKEKEKGDEHAAETASTVLVPPEA